MPSSCVWDSASAQMLGYKSGELQSGAILFSKEYGFLCETEGAEELLEQIREG